MEAAVQAKRSQLEQLQAENDQLRSKARVLETAERCSVEIHELMKLLDGLQVGGLQALWCCLTNRLRGVSSPTPTHHMPAEGMHASSGIGSVSLSTKPTLKQRNGLFACV
jgi:hypothetical protein